MKQRFTLFQKIMTVIFIALEAAVLACDAYRLVFVDGDGKYYYIVNLVLSVLLLGVFLMLIFDPKLCISDDETDDPERLFPIISASRTYMCFIAVDISAIFAFVMFAAKYFENPAFIIVIGGVAVFVIGAVKYVIDSGRIGIISEDESAEDTEKAEETKNSEKAEETAEAVETKESAESADSTKETEETEEAKVTEGSEEIKETEEIAETVETAETVEHTEPDESTDEAEDTKETEEAENTENTEDTEDIKENTDEPLEEKAEAEKVSQTD